MSRTLYPHSQYFIVKLLSQVPDLKLVCCIIEVDGHPATADVQLYINGTCLNLGICILSEDFCPDFSYLISLGV